MSQAPRVADLMTAQPVSVHPDDTLREAVKRFERYPFRHLPVEQGNRLVGMLSDRDMALAMALPRGPREPGHGARCARRVSEVLSAPVRTITPGEPAVAAVELLLAHRIGALPVVVEGDRLTGIVTSSDVLRRYFRVPSGTRGPAPGDAPVASLMTGPVLTVRPDDDLLDAAGRLMGSHVRHLPVEQDGELLGMLSDRDVRRGLARLVAEDRRVEELASRAVPYLSVADVCSRPCMTLPPEAPLHAAAHAMLECRIGALPIVEREVLVGIVTQTDLLRHYRDWKPGRR